jgi:hypothetical protein
MLSELSGTPLPPGAGWDAAARTRLAQFQRSEGFNPTGVPDDTTVARLQLRYETTVAAQTHAPSQSPSVEC